MKKAIVIAAALALFSGCNIIHPSMYTWNSKTQSYEDSKWYKNQLSKIRIEPDAEGYMMIMPSEEEAIKAGVNKRIYRTMKHQVDLINEGKEE